MVQYLHFRILNSHWSWRVCFFLRVESAQLFGAFEDSGQCTPPSKCRIVEPILVSFRRLTGRWHRKSLRGSGPFCFSIDAGHRRDLPEHALPRWSPVVPLAEILGIGLASRSTWSHLWKPLKWWAGFMASAVASGPNWWASGTKSVSTTYAWAAWSRLRPPTGHNWQGTST
jgi:hypothetical protein